MIRQEPWASAPCHWSMGDSWARTPHCEILRLGPPQDPPISPWSFGALWRQGVMLITHRQMRKTDSGWELPRSHTALEQPPKPMSVLVLEGRASPRQPGQGLRLLQSWVLGDPMGSGGSRRHCMGEVQGAGLDSEHQVASLCSELHPCLLR